MANHPDESKILQYISGEAQETVIDEMEAHIVECEECFERIKALYFLKVNFSEVWENLNANELRSIAEIQNNSANHERGHAAEPEKEGLHLLGASPKKQRKLAQRIREATIMKRKAWIGISAAAAVLVIAIGTMSLTGTFKSSNAYSEWKAAGIIAQNADMNKEIGKTELTEMLTNLAGTKIPETDEIPSDRDLMVQDAADAIAACFKLKEADKAAMIKGLTPDARLTYKSAVALVDNFAGELDVTGNSKEAINGNYAVNLDGTVVKDKNISGNLYVMQGIGNGEVTLSNVKVAGRVYVLGGGMSTVILDNSTTGDMIVNKADGKVRVLAREGSSVASVELNSGAKLQNDSSQSDAFKTVKVSGDVPKDSEIKLNGSFTSVNVEAAGVKIDVEKGNIQELAVSKDATGVELNINKDASIENLAPSPDLKISGEGQAPQAVNETTGSVAVKDEFKDYIYTKYPDFDKWDDVKKQIIINDIELVMGLANDFNSIQGRLKNGEVVTLDNYVILPYQTFPTGTYLKSQIEDKCHYFDVDLDLLLKDKDTSKEIKDFLETGIILEADKLKEVTKLDLLCQGDPSTSDTDIRDISFIKEFTGLADLTVRSFGNVNDISSISQLTGLKRLTVMHMPKLSDLSFLASLKQLEYLDLRFLAPQDLHCSGVEALKELTSLKTIVMQNEASWIPYIYYAPNLEEVILYFYHGDNSLFAKIKNLKRLEIHNSNVLGQPDWQLLTGLNLDYLCLDGGDGLLDSEKQEISDQISALDPSEVDENTGDRMQRDVVNQKIQALKGAVPNCSISVD